MFLRVFGSVLLILLMMVSTALAGFKADELQPSDDVLSEPISLGYYLALRRSLSAEHEYRKCQVLTVPSFAPEWAVYLIRDDTGPAQVVYKVLKTQLWLDMPYNRPQAEAGSNAPEANVTGEPSVERTIAMLSAPTAELLERVWVSVLARVKYPETITLGVDGTSYYVSHWQRGLGVRSGKTWSPDSQSPAGALVALATALRTYALADVHQRGSIEIRLGQDAAALLERLTSSQ